MSVIELKLNCWVRSEDPGGDFWVKIPETETVYDLQEAIKNKISGPSHDLHAHAIRLYKPTTPGFSPCKDNITFSDHAELLSRGRRELLEIFPEQPPEDDIHVIVDAPSEIRYWLRHSTLDASFAVSIQVGTTTSEVKQYIKKTQSSLANVDEQYIRLYRIQGGEDELRECLAQMGKGEPLERDVLMANFVGVPILNPLRVVIEVAAVGGNSPTTVQQEPIDHRDAVREYEDIFLKVGRWERFEKSDIEGNQMVEAQGDISSGIPEFVTAFEQKLVRRPHLSLRSQMSSNIGRYFEDWIPESEFREDMRSAEASEVHNTGLLADLEWQELWEPDGAYKRPFKEYTATSVFFDAVLLSPQNKMGIAMKNKSWPMDVIVQCDGDNELRKYRPRSDLLISNNTIPRLLVEVNSTPQSLWPKDLVRMLTTGAFVVRFANKFVSTFRQKKNFVLCAFFIWDNGRALRHTLFQIPNDETVYFNKREFSLNEPLGRVEFERHLYTILGAEFDEDQNQVGKEAVDKLRNKIRDGNLKSLYTKIPTSQNKSRKRVRTEDNASGAEGGNGLAQLRAHGYEVKPEVTVDASGGVWEPLFKSPDHILTVYRPTSSKEEIIAKKVRKGSNELEIFRLLDTMALKSDHVISLIDSFDGWLILPKMITIQDYVDFRDTKVFERKVSQVCLGIIKGVAYLHEHHIAHRDIKPDNLVVDKNLHSKIIDFDIAMRVKDDDEEVDNQCGTRGWMAHEVEKGLRHSPIKADRWACGRVILFLLDMFCKEDESLRTFAKDLVSHDPKQRPSLVESEWYLAPPLSDAGNSDARKALRLRRDRGVNRDGTVTPPDVKRQKLESGQWCNTGIDGHGLGLKTGAH